MRLTLLIDTTIQGVFMALCDLDKRDPEFLWHYTVLDNKGSSNTLSELFERALATTPECKDNKIQNIVVSHGPGSFTGIKVGLSFAYGLKRGSNNNIKILGVSSFTEILRELTNTDALFLPSTKTQGYIAIKGEHDISTSNLDLNRYQDIVHHSAPVVIGRWQELENKFNESNVKFTSLDISQASLLSLTGMLKKSLRANENNFSDFVLPEPLYLRAPTVFAKG